MTQTQPDDEPPSRLPALAAILFVLGLVAGGFYLSRYLAAVSRTEDCMMAGRRACGEVIRGG